MILSILADEICDEKYDGFDRSKVVKTPVLSGSAAPESLGARTTLRCRFSADEDTIVTSPLTTVM